MLQCQKEAQQELGGKDANKIYSQHTNEAWTPDINDFSCVELIASTTRSSIYKGYLAKRNMIAVIKRQQIPLGPNAQLEEGYESLKAELTIHKNLFASNKFLKRPNIVEFYGCTLNEGHWFIFQEYMDCSLRELTLWMREKSTRRPEEMLNSVAVNLLDALLYLRDNRVVHRDVKPQHVLANKDGEIKLCDFSTAKTYEDSDLFITANGTLPYWSPERFVSEHYDSRVDIWALGITLAETAYGYIPIEQSMGVPSYFVAKGYITEVINKDPRKFINLCLQDYSQEAKDFVLACLRDVDTRPNHKLLAKEAFYKKFSDDIRRATIQTLVKEYNYNLTLITYNKSNNL